MADEITDCEIEVKLKELQDWIDAQPEMPKKFEKLLLLRYLKLCRWRVEKASQILKQTIVLRTEHPHIFTNRDPQSEVIQNIFEVGDMVPLLKTTPENYKICIFRMTNDDVDHIDFNDVIKAFFMMSDVRLITPEEKLSDGEISIFDMSQLSYKHFTKVIYSTVRFYLKYIQEAHPVRLRQVHILNSSGMIDRVMSLVKPFVPSKHLGLIHLHTPGSETLFDFIPRNILPNEIGGSAGPIADVRAVWMDKLVQHRDYLMNDETWQLIPQQDNNNDNASGGVLDFFF